MSFLNASLIIGLLAAAIPVVLHLISRREPERRVFPAVRFLTQRIEANRSRLKVRRWLLLALRAGLLALLAIALAQPQMHHAASATWLTIGLLIMIGVALLLLGAWALVRGVAPPIRWGLLAAGVAMLLGALTWGGAVWAGSERLNVSDTAPAAIAIVIDNSPRTGYQHDQQTVLQQMQETARWLVSRYPRDSQIAIIDRSARPASYSLDSAAAARAIDRIEPRQLLDPLPARIEAAVRLVRSSDLDRRAVFVLSDASRQSWMPESAPDAASVLPPLLAEEPPVALQIVDLHAPPADTATALENRRLGLPQLADTTPAREVPVPLSIKVHVEQTQPIPVRGELQLYEQSQSLPVVRDGAVVLPPLRTVDRTAGEAAAGSPAELFLTLPPLPPGTHHGRVRLSGTDALPVDDVRYLTVTVRPPARLLILTQDAPAADLLARVLNAEFAPDDPRAEFAIQRMSPEQFSAAALENLDAIAWLDPNPPQLSTAAGEALLEWIRGGGNLFMALGAATTAAAEDGSPPAGGDSLRQTLFPLRRVWRVPEGTFLELTRPSHPINRVLSDLPGGVPWNRFPIYRYWQVEPVPSDAVLARFAGTQHAALVERPLDAGRVVWMTTPMVPSSQHAMASWNELFIAADYWPAFLLTRQIFDYVGNRDVGTFNVTVGEPVTVPLLEENRSTERLQMFAAESPPVPVPVNDGLAMVGVPQRAGNYWLRGVEPAIGFAVNLDESVTRLETIAPALFDDLLGVDNYDLVTDRASILAAEGRHSEARPLYAQAMLLVLALFVLEQVLSNRFYGSAGGSLGLPSRRRIEGIG